MKCPRCQQEIHSSAKFCPECGATTAETPRVIRGPTTDVQPVLTAVVKTAARLCDANDALIWQVEGDQLAKARNRRHSQDDEDRPMNIAQSRGA